MFGVRSGDTEHLRVLSPDGTLLAESKGAVPKNQAQRLRFVGKRG